MIPPSPPPETRRDLWRHWIGTPVTALVSLISATVALYTTWALLDWTVISAASPARPMEDCAGASGACWRFYVEKSRFMLFGTYPYAEHWRPALVSTLLLALSALVGGCGSPGGCAGFGPRCLWRCGSG